MLQKQRGNIMVTACKQKIEGYKKFRGEADGGK